MSEPTESTIITTRNELSWIINIKPKINNRMFKSSIKDAITEDVKHINENPMVTSSEINFTIKEIKTKLEQSSL